MSSVDFEFSGFSEFFDDLRAAARGGFRKEMENFLEGIGEEFLRIVQDEIIRRKVIPVEIVRESLVILIALTSFAVFIAGALFVTESAALAAGTVSLDALVFEAISAVTTTGLSVGSTTASLSGAGRVVVIVAMFIGRLGALTVVMMIGDKETKRHIRYPTEEIVVG